MLVPTRRDLAANLAAYGEPEASAKIPTMSQLDFDRVCRIGFEHALSGMRFAKASRVAAVEVLEGGPRALTRERRVWGDVPAELRQPDPQSEAIDAWFDEYSGGRPVKKPEIFEHLSQSMSDALPEFKYFKSFAHFRRPFRAGISYIDLDRGHSMVSLRFGVRHDDIETIKRTVFRIGSRKADHFDRTISKFSMNMGPMSPFWWHPTHTNWPILASKGLERAAGEISEFVLEVVVPYLTIHEDPLAIRSTMLGQRGHCDQHLIDECVFAVDLLSKRRDWLEEDFSHLQQRYSRFGSDDVEKVKSRYRIALEHLDRAP